MPAQIFISCGQATIRERAVADRLRQALTDDGFCVYVAIQAQSIEDVNSGIIRQLERSDYYVFIDFRRERLSWFPRLTSRGSLFTHQELAMAFRSGFERVLFFQETGTKLEGLLRYMGANPIRFTLGADLVGLVRQAIRDRDWRSDYSRHLTATRLRGESVIIRTPRITGRFFFIDIENRRTDTAAYATIARLEYVTTPGGERMPSRDRGPLKVTGQNAFSQVIWPLSHGAVDLLAIGVDPPHGVYLHTALDLPRIEPLLTQRGRYKLDYAVLARDFPVLRFAVDLELTGLLATATVALRGL